MTIAEDPKFETTSTGNDRNVPSAKGKFHTNHIKYKPCTHVEFLKAPDTSKLHLLKAHRSLAALIVASVVVPYSWCSYSIRYHMYTNMCIYMYTLYYMYIYAYMYIYTYAFPVYT